MMRKPYSMMKSFAKHLINYFSNVIPILSIPKPKSFPMGNTNLEPIMSTKHGLKLNTKTI